MKKKYYLKLKKDLNKKITPEHKQIHIKKKKLSNQNFLCKNEEEKKVQDRHQS